MLGIYFWCCKRPFLRKDMLWNAIISCMVFANLVHAQTFSTASQAVSHLLSTSRGKGIKNNVYAERRNEKGVTPLRLVFLPPSFKTQRCLDGSRYGYYIRRSTSLTNSRKWIIFLMGGGACITPMDCTRRKTSPRGWGSSRFWNSTFVPGTDFPGFHAMHDVLSDNPVDNPSFFDYNHVYLQYCSGDLWTGTRKSFNNFGLWFSGHNNIKAVIQHLKHKENLAIATHILLLGVSAGGWGLYNNADFILERWIPKSTVVKAVPIDGFIAPGPVTLYQLYTLGIRIPLNGMLSKYLTTWYRSALDESCKKSTPIWKWHECLDVSHLYNFIDTPIFVIQNRFDKLIMENFLNAPLEENPNYSTKNFMKWYGDLTANSIASKIVTKRGKYKGDGLFLPSCLNHAGNFCLSGGTNVNGKNISDMLPKWFLENNPFVASNYQEIDACNSFKRTKFPCNPTCECLAGNTQQGNSNPFGY